MATTAAVDSKKEQFVEDKFEEISNTIPYKTGYLYLRTLKFYLSLSFFMKVLFWITLVNGLILAGLAAKKLFDLNQETFTRIVVCGMLAMLAFASYVAAFLYAWV